MKSKSTLNQVNQVSSLFCRCFISQLTIFHVYRQLKVRLIVDNSSNERIGFFYVPSQAWTLFLLSFKEIRPLCSEVGFLKKEVRQSYVISGLIEAHNIQFYSSFHIIIFSINALREKVSEQCMLLVYYNKTKFEFSLLQYLAIEKYATS